MNNTIRSSVQRVRTIIAANMNSYVVGFLLTAIVCGIIEILTQMSIIPNFLAYINMSLQLTIGLIILMPVLVYGLKSVSTKSRGVSEVSLNVIVMKRNLFFALGVVWVSIGVLALASTWGGLDNIKYTASVLLALSWWFINEIIISYVKDI